MRRHAKISIKVLRKGQLPLTYSDYTRCSVFASSDANYYALTLFACFAGDSNTR